MVDRLVLRQRARSMRSAPTVAEAQLWELLRAGRLDGLNFRRQVPIGDYIADFACFSPKVIVEADGGSHRNPEYDAARDAWFRAQGFVVVRLRNEEVAADTTRELILRACRRL